MKTNSKTQPPIWMKDALKHLQASDPKFARLIKLIGPCLLPCHRQHYATLVKSIISQQISTKAAESIYGRFCAAIAPARMLPAPVAALSEEEMKAAGLSPQKRGYLRDLTNKVISREVRLNQLHKLTDEEIIAELTLVKGIGIWTAQMFLIFSLNRPNVFPSEDLGVRNALRNVYRLSTSPDKKEALKIAEPWAPFGSVAAWYLWRSLDLPPETWLADPQE